MVDHYMHVSLVYFEISCAQDKAVVRLLYYIYKQCFRSSIYCIHIFLHNSIKNLELYKSAPLDFEIVASMMWSSWTQNIYEKESINSVLKVIARLFLRFYSIWQCYANRRLERSIQYGGCHAETPPGFAFN